MFTPLPETKYYDELVRTSKTVLTEIDMGETCLEFSRVLKTLDADTYKAVVNCMYALILVHSIKSGTTPSLFPYNFKRAETSTGEYAVTLNLSKLPVALQRVLLKYMSDCLASENN